MKHCRHCRFAEAIGTGKRGGQGEDVDVGACHLNPPAVGPLALPIIALDFDWCWGFKRRWWWRK